MYRSRYQPSRRTVLTEVHIHKPLTAKLHPRLIYNTVSKSKLTQNVRRILTSQKTFANHLADEEAALTLQDQNQSASSFATARSSSSRPAKTSSLQKRSSASHLPIASSNSTQPDNIASADAEPTATAHALKDPGGDDPLLKSYIPDAPSEAFMNELVSRPALSYNSARVAPASGKPQRRFCEICGYWGTIKCIKCGARVCSLDCRNAHADGRCIFYA